MRDYNQIPSSPQSDFQGMYTIKSAAVDRFIRDRMRKLLKSGLTGNIFCTTIVLYLTEVNLFVSLCKTQSYRCILQRPLKDCSELWLEMTDRVPSSGILNTRLSNKNMTKYSSQDNSFTAVFEEEDMKKVLYYNSPWSCLRADLMYGFVIK